MTCEQYPGLDKILHSYMFLLSLIIGILARTQDHDLKQNRTLYYDLGFNQETQKLNDLLPSSISNSQDRIRILSGDKQTFLF